MTAFLEKINIKSDESFSIGIFQDNLEESHWHYHNNFEISFITEGNGKRIVADSIVDFSPGDLVILGPNIPHVWLADKDIMTPTARKLEMVYLQFTSDIFFPQMTCLPEFTNIKRALNNSERGIQITGHTLYEVSELMLQLPYMKKFERFLHLLKILDIIGRSYSNIHLASESYMKGRFRPVNQRIEKVHDFLMTNYQNRINLSELANIVNMAEGSLCRMFRSTTGLSPFEYLNKIRIDFACKLLMDINLNISEISYDCGFLNISHFNKQFRKYTGLTPSLYRKQYLELRN